MFDRQRVQLAIQLEDVQSRLPQFFEQHVAKRPLLFEFMKHRGVQISARIVCDATEEFCGDSPWQRQSASAYRWRDRVLGV